VPSLAGFLGAISHAFSHAAAPVERVVQRVAASVEHAVQQAAAPVEHAVQHIAAPVQQAVQRVAAPVQRAVQQAAAPVEHAVQQAAAPVEHAVQHLAAPVQQAVHQAAAPVERAVAPVEHALAQAVQQVTSDRFSDKVRDLPHLGPDRPAGKIPLPLPGPGESPGGIALLRPGGFPGGWINLPGYGPSGLPGGIDYLDTPSGSGKAQAFLDKSKDFLSTEEGFVDKYFRPILQKVEEKGPVRSALAEIQSALKEVRGNIHLPRPGGLPGGIDWPLPGPDLPGGIHVPLPGPDLPGGIHLPLPGPDLPGGIHLPLPGPDLPGGIHPPRPGGFPGGIDWPLPGPDLPGGIHLPRPGGIPGGGLDFPGLRGGAVLKNEQETDPHHKPGQEQGPDAGSPPTGSQPTEINEKTDLTDPSTWPRPPREELGPYREGDPSRQRPRARGEKSLYDREGGEWRPHKPDKYHPQGHWDYKPPSPWNAPWENVNP
jgi:hypothetical protein